MGQLHTDLGLSSDTSPEAFRRNVEKVQDAIGSGRPWEDFLRPDLLERWTADSEMSSEDRLEALRLLFVLKAAGCPAVDEPIHLLDRRALNLYVQFRLDKLQAVHSAYLMTRWLLVVAPVEDDTHRLRRLGDQWGKDLLAIEHVREALGAPFLRARSGAVTKAVSGAVLPYEPWDVIYSLGPRQPQGPYDVAEVRERFLRNYHLRPYCTDDVVRSLLHYTEQSAWHPLNADFRRRVRVLSAELRRLHPDVLTRDGVVISLPELSKALEHLVALPRWADGSNLERREVQARRFFWGAAAQQRDVDRCGEALAEASRQTLTNSSAHLRSRPPGDRGPSSSR